MKNEGVAERAKIII